MILLAISAKNVSAAPQIYVQQPSHNFGTLIQGKKLDHSFTIKNNGDAPLKISHIRPACGCTAVNASSPVVNPGKTSEIKISFNSASFFGNVSKTVAVESNDPVTPLLTLTLTGNIVEEVSVKPKQLNLGQVKPEVAAANFITVENRSNKPLKLTSVKSPMPQLVIKTDKTQIKPGESARISVTVTPRQEDRMLSGYITISTDNPDKQEIMVPVYGSLSK
jgi:copper(I)-binding protein